MTKAKKEVLDPTDPDYLVKSRERYLEQEKAGAQAAMTAAAEDTENPFPSPLRPNFENLEDPAGMAGGKLAKGADEAGMTFPDAPDRGEDAHGAAAKKGKK